MMPMAMAIRARSSAALVAGERKTASIFDQSFSSSRTGLRSAQPVPWHTVSVGKLASVVTSPATRRSSEPLEQAPTAAARITATREAAEARIRMETQFLKERHDGGRHRQD